MLNPYMGTPRTVSKERKKGSADLLVLAIIEHRPRHGYEIARLIEERSNGALSYHVASLYPTLYRLEDKGLIEGRWVEKAGQRRRRCYRLTIAGRKVLATERSVWQHFFLALDLVAGLRRS
jgi:PadR family transcriptional regulator, regulatory protein PadR